jgi:hypothetical protein
VKGGEKSYVFAAESHEDMEKYVHYLSLDNYMVFCYF